MADAAPTGVVAMSYGTPSRSPRPPPGDLVGVLVMSYGTPYDASDVERYYTDIRRGRAPSAEALADLQARYDAIGGTFPLREITEAQAAGLQRALDEHVPGGFIVELGAKHSAPTVEDGVRALAERGVSRAVGLVLAPHYAAMSVGAYAERAATVGRERGVEVDTIESWHLLPAYVDFLAAAVDEARGRVPEGSEVVFTAHSLPARIVDAGDPYPDQLAETAAAVAERAGLRRWSVGWQSAGRTAESWLGPDVADILRDRTAARAAGAVVCACGFTADHLEVAYDLDLEAARLAVELGLPFARTRSMNADPAVLAALADLVVERAAGATGARGAAGGSL
jgi:ferrochelatase